MVVFTLGINIGHPLIHTVLVIALEGLLKSSRQVRNAKPSLASNAVIFDFHLRPSNTSLRFEARNLKV